MNIEEVIDWLSNCDYDGTEHGWCTGGSFRGYYDCFSVKPADRYCTTQEMIEVLVDAIGETYCGYKGGEYTMHGNTEVYYAPHGSSGPLITKGFLRAMFTDPEFYYEDFE